MRMHQLDANDESLNTSYQQKDQRENDVQNPNPLVIDCSDPLMHGIDPRLLLNLQRGNCGRIR
ncbi:MAG TPA: hypothetical protein VE242_04535 [Chthoniobacterales bacterium]|nr:hypothetical protein [Chthoniobacterales bacterium]